MQYSTSSELSVQCCVATVDEGNDIDIWHFRLGHASEQCVKNTAKEELATGINFPKHAKLSFCEGCVTGKMKRAP